MYSLFSLARLASKHFANFSRDSSRRVEDGFWQFGQPSLIFQLFVECRTLSET